MCTCLLHAARHSTLTQLHVAQKFGTTRKWRMVIVHNINIIISKSYIAHVKQGTQGAEYNTNFQKDVIEVTNYETQCAHRIRVCKVLWRIQQSQPGTSGRTPSLFNERTVFFYMPFYTTHGTNGFTSHPKDEAMDKCLAFKSTCKCRIRQ